MKEEAFYSVKNCSKRFADFLSGLGCLINIKQCCNSYFLGGLPKTGADGLYGILWRDKLMQVFFHVNTLMQHIDIETNLSTNNETSVLSGNLTNEEIDKEQIISKIKKYINNDNAVILWNESGEEIQQEYLKSNKVDIFIIIKPLVTNYCQIIVKNVILY